MSLSEKKVFLLDMDGTFYLGNRLIPGAIDFIHILLQKKKSFYFLTNNSAHNAQFYQQKLARMGLDLDREHIITSGEVCAWFLSQVKAGGRFFLLGTSYLERELLKVGLVSVQENPDFVVLGFDTDLSYSRLEKACRFIRRGVSFYATHPDINCPTEYGPIPDAGSMISLISASTGKSPKILGKPFPEIIEYVMARTKTNQNDIVMIGDRLYTDIAMGKQSGITTVLVLSGETQEADIPKSPFQPDYIFPSIKEMNFTTMKRK